MAARLRPHHQEEVRTRIQTSQLVNRLTSHVLGECEMSPTQVQAANILLKKSLPDLQAIALGPGDEETAKKLAGIGAFGWRPPQ